VLEVWHVFFAFVPGFVLMLLYFFDHQVLSCFGLLARGLNQTAV
jgi:hypothetical protein